jgi:hypothetical protein
MTGGMGIPTLTAHGDSEEQRRWPDVGKHFPLYERFWQTHIFTLRDARGRIRADIDERLELMAQEHYKCFISVSIVQSRDPARPERTFSSLQNAANRAQDVISCFNSVQASCVPKAKQVSDNERFANFARSIRRYRNFVHEDVVGLLEDRDHHRCIPLPDKLDKYKRWSRFHHADPKDFVVVEDYIGQSFAELCALLDENWRHMLEQSGELLASSGYRELLPPLEQPVPMQQVVLCSNVQIW